MAGRTVNRTVVISSTVRSVGYDQDASVLEIEFHTGSVYQYLGVPEHVFAEFLVAPSKGTYFNENIRSQYAYKEV